MGSPPSVSGEAGAHSQPPLGKPCLYGNMRDHCVVVCCHQLYGAICKSLVSVPRIHYPAFLGSKLTRTSFQEVQGLSALQASIRILPSLVVGALLNLTTGFFVDRIPALWIVTVSSVLCAGAPLLMAVVQPEWTYWANAFVAQVLQPISADALFTVGLIVISDVFPDDTQALAGAVFNTAAQFGGAFGLAVMQIVSTLVTKENEGMERTKAVMEGYRASFWTMFGFMMVCGVVGGLCLRKTGRVGLKRD